MIYKANNNADNVLDLDKDDIYDFILNKLELTRESEDFDIIEALKTLTRTAKKLHELAIETQIPIYDILKIIVKERPDLVDKRFLTRMRKLYNTGNS